MKTQLLKKVKQLCWTCIANELDWQTVNISRKLTAFPRVASSVDILKSILSGQTILDLGCGWGSVALFVSAKYPESKVFALSNSATQREFIMEEAQERGIKNLTVFTGDVAIFQREDWYTMFDRIISIGNVLLYFNVDEIFHHLDLTFLFTK